MSPRKRKQLFVDHQVQGTILLRIGWYWLFCFLFVSLSVLLFQTLSHPDQPFQDHVVPVLARFWPVYLALVVIAPFVLYDALKVSNRFCGPLQRVVRELEHYNRTGEYNGLTFRDNDFWQPLSHALSEAIDRSGKKELQADSHVNQ